MNVVGTKRKKGGLRTLGLLLARLRTLGLLLGDEEHEQDSPE